MKAKTRRSVKALFLWWCLVGTAAAAEDFPKPYSPPCVERENVFEFTQKPAVKVVGQDRYEITFAVKGNCDATVDLVGTADAVVRHLASGVLGSNAPVPFQRNSLKQTIYWDGKDDFGAYVAEPGRCRLRVRLGLKPEFDKCLGGTDGRHIPGQIWGLAADAQGVYVFSMNRGSRLYLRHFDFNGKYVKTVFPPPANMPEEKLQGMGYVEYEPGKRALHSTDGYQTTAYEGKWLPCVLWGAYDPFSSGGESWCQPVAAKGRIYYLNTGCKGGKGSGESALHYVYTDGSTDIPGTAGRRFYDGGAHRNRWLAASADGKWIYMTGLTQAASPGCVVVRASADGTDNARIFAGEFAKPGGDDAHFNEPRGLACDAQGRVYVCDSLNNRLQIFSPDGKFLKSVAVDRPSVVQVHQKTGAIYVLHTGKKEGLSTSRLTRLGGFENPVPAAYVDVSDVLKVPASSMALDSWSPQPKIWLGVNYRPSENMLYEIRKTDKDWLYPYVTIWEEAGDTFKKTVDFHVEARREAGKGWSGKWSGNTGARVVCDPTRERAWFGGWSERSVFDMKTGEFLGKVSSPVVDDIAFDKRGYMHCHFNPAEYLRGVGRVDTDRSMSRISSEGEIPYDYGIDGQWATQKAWSGILPTRDQGSSKGFQDGIGVNMRGDVVVHSSIVYIPRMDDMVKDNVMGGAMADKEGRGAGDWSQLAYARFLRMVEDMEKKGEEVASVPRRPGIPSYATIWTFDRTGQLRKAFAVIMGNHVNGVQIDEDGKLYFTSSSRKMYGGEPFLKGRGGVFGVPDLKLPPHLCAELAYRNFQGGSVRDPKTGSFFKTGGKEAYALLKNPLTCASSVAIPADPWPSRPQEILGGWLEGDFEWVYAGASPMVQEQCSCPTFRAHTDWYKRSFVQEQYRHSFAALDTNGNLILHFGRYANFDSGQGAGSSLPVGGDNITMCFAKTLSGTDNYLCYEDFGERLVVLKLNYHAEETAGIGGR